MAAPIIASDMPAFITTVVDDASFLKHLTDSLKAN